MRTTDRPGYGSLLPLLCGCLWTAALASAAGPRQHLSLDGEWRFQLDPQDAGQAEAWFTRPDHLTSRIQVPGCWQAQGFGAPVGVLRHHYEGAAWYARHVTVPADWRGKTIQLVVGGAFTYTTAYVNGMPAGTHEGFSTAFRFDVTALVKPGSGNLIMFRVVNVKDPLQGQRRALTARDTTDLRGALNLAAPWGGIYGRVELEAHDPARIERVAITTRILDPRAEVEVFVRNDGTAELPQAAVEVTIGESARQSVPLNLPAGTAARATVRVSVPAARLWSPDTPNLYQARVSLRQGARVVDAVSETFGFREIRVDGPRLLLNGKPLYLRGYGDDSSEMLTGAPPHDKQVYLERMRVAKELGFNAVRFHSTSPVRECFEAADETGMLITAELPVVYQEFLLPHKDLLRRELVRIIDAHRNHPSWFFFTLGNEFGLQRIPDATGKEVFLGAVQELVSMAKERYPGLLVSSNSGYLVPPMDVAVPYRGLAAGLPNIKHEYGAYYCTLPDISLIPKFTGVYEPRWLHTAKAWIDARGLGEEYRSYWTSSARLYGIAAKAYLEKLRTLPEFTGYFYWLINDFPGGTLEGGEWNWGWLDLFWQPKQISPGEGRQMNAAVLPLIDLPPDSRTFWLEDGVSTDVLVSNFGDTPLAPGKLTWSLAADGRRLASGEAQLAPAPLGAISKVGRIRIGALAGTEALETELTVSLEAGTGRHENRWKLWGFPRAGLAQSGALPVFSMVKSADLKRWFPFLRDAAGEDSTPALLASGFHPRVIDTLRAGGRVLLLAEPGRFGGRTTYFPASFGGGLGLRIDKAHAALRGFPHDGFPDLQFYNLLEGGAQVDPASAPILGGIRMTRAKPDNLLSRVAFLSEARVGKGKLLLCGLNIRPNLDGARPEAVYLLDRLLRYLASAEFNPTIEISLERIDDIRVPYTEMIH